MIFERFKGVFHRLEEVDSTNTYALQLLKNSLPSQGTVVITESQTAGKGQRGNHWKSNTGENLTFSVILLSDIEIKNAYYLSMICALAVHRTLMKYLSGVEIKWPNDILVDGKKIAGILIENQIRGNRITSSVAGIGLNVNQTHFQSELTACSMKTICGKDMDRETIFQEIYTNLDFYFARLTEQNTSLISRRYHDQLYGLDKMLQFEDAGGSFSAIIQGVDEDGKLKLMRDGKIFRYALKELRFSVNL